MSTIEKLFVQLFDQKRQIIEELDHQKQLYDKYLLSKLLIQGIPPPPWLLNFDSQSSTAGVTALNKEDFFKGLLLSRSEAFASYPVGPCILYEKPPIAAANSGIPDETAIKSASSNGINEDGPGVAPLYHVDGTEDMAGIAPSSHVPAARSGLPDETCAVKSASSNGIDAVGAGATPLYHVDGTEDVAGIAPPSHVDGSVETFSYVPMSPEDQTDTRFSNGCQLELSHARLHRSKSRQKALELRNSAKASGKRSLGMEKSVGISSGSKTCRYDEQLDGFKETLELAEQLCSNKEVAVGNSLEKERSGDAYGVSLAQITDTKAKELKSRNNEMEKNSTVYGGRITRSRSSSQQLISTHSGSETYRFDKLFDGSSGSSKMDEHSRLATEMCFKEEAGSEILSEKERNIDASGDSFTRSIINEEQESDFKNGQKTREYSKICGSRITRSRSSCQQSFGGDLLLENKSNGVCVGQTTRSRSSKAQRTMEDSKAYRITRSRSSGQLSVGEAHPLEKNCNEACVVRMTRSRSGKTQQTEVAMGNSGAYSGKVTRSRSCVAEASNLRSMSRKDVSVKPKQLDFDDVEEPNLFNVAFHLSDVQASSLSHGKDVGGSNLSELEAEVNTLRDFNFNHDVDGSWPAYKRRKIEYQNLNKSACTTLRAKPFLAINENIPSTSVHTEKANIPLASEHSTNSHNSKAALSDCVLAEETDWSVTSLSKEHVSTPQVQCSKYKVSSGRAVVASTCERLQLSKPDIPKERRSIIAESSDSLPEDGEVKKNLPWAILISGRVSDGLVNGQDMVDCNTAAKLTYTEGAVNQGKSPQRIDRSKFSIGSPHMEHMNVTEADQTIPEFEGFIIGDNTVDAQNSQNELFQKEIPLLSSIMDNISLPEQICESAALGTPLSPFPTACKLYVAPGMYSSVPNGLLENNGLRSNLLTSGSALLGKSHSDLFSFPGSQYGWDNKKPFLSPVGKGFEGITSKSGGSDKLGNSNLELTCFPILEDPESGEEDVNDAVNLVVKRSESSAEVVANKGLLFDITLQSENSLAPEVAVERVGLESMNTEVRRNDSSTRRSGNKEPFCDISLQNESTLALDHPIERRSQGSVGTNISIHEINDNKESSMGQKKSRQTRPGKENKDFSVGATANSSKKHSKPLSSRFSKPKLSGQSCLRSRGQSVLEKEQKRNNIVSGVKSFVPLVQQKQAAAAVPEKKDVKVKALQAAEAAKRAADMRENERKQKKEAMKLERARVEQEKMKELELRKKLKEDQRKKREAENAAKKRQREEEEKKEKERKKRRIEEARLQQKQAEEKLHAWKEGSRCAAEDERAHQEKDSNEKTENQIGKETEGNSGKPMNDAAVVGNDQREANAGLPALIDNKMSTGSSACGKMSNIDVAESSTPSFDKIEKQVNQISQSYDLSPYRDSDDEEEEEDEIPNKKFVPSWASKTCVISALSSLEHFNPDVIFPPGSFCSMEEVLLPRRLLQK